MNGLILAHGIGSRSDLPVPLWMAMYGGATAVIISFLVLMAFWRKARYEDDVKGRPLPGFLRSFFTSRAAGVIGHVIGVALLLWTLIVLQLGSSNSASNPAPWWFYIWFWVGLVPLSIIFGPVWRAFNPLRPLARLLRGSSEPLPYPTGWGFWPAAVSLFTFVWLELVYTRPDEPSIVMIYLVLYVIFNVWGGSRYGDHWFDRADGFEVYSTLIAGVSPFGRDPDGTPVFRDPLRGLARLTTDPGLVGVVTVILGSTAFDGITRTDQWSNIIEGASDAWYLISGTLGLLGAIASVALTFTLATRFAPGRSAVSRSDMPGRFVHSLIPIAIGYTVAHYFSLFIFEGQWGYILASDPLDRGWDLFGTSDWLVNYLLVGTAVIAWVQVLGIVIGHILGVTAAHDRAMAVFPKSDQLTGQLPLLIVMVIYTLGGIGLLVGA